MADKRAQYKPTPELQSVLDQLSGSIKESLKLGNEKPKLRSFSRFDDDKDKFTLYFDANSRIFRADIKQQKLEGNKAKIQLLKLSEIVMQK